MRAPVYSRLIAASVLTLLSLSGSGVSASDAVSDEMIRQLPKIRDFVEVPIKTLRAVETEDGKIFFLNETGRYVISGMLFDAWTKQKLDSVRGMRNNFTHIRLSEMGFKTSDFSAIAIGSGSKEVFVFADPLCRWCHELINEIRSDKAADLRKNYRFLIVAVPALGDESARLVKHLTCTKEKSDDKKLDAFVGRAIESIPSAETAACTAAYERLLIASHMLGIRSVPFVIAPDGRFTAGKPKDLAAWLNEGDKRLEKEAEELRAALKRTSERLKNNRQ